MISGCASLGEVDWESLYDGLPTAFHAPRSERGDIDALCGQGAAAYGEIEAVSVQRLLDWITPTADDALYDLGSGGGRLLVQAVCTSEVGRAVGIELSAFRHQLANTARTRLLARLTPELAAATATRLEFRREDLRHCDLSDATLCYAGSTCFPDSLLQSLASHLSRNARHLRRLISAKPLPNPRIVNLREIGRIDLEMTWASDVGVHVYAPH